MNYNALLLLDKHHNHKLNNFTITSNNDQLSFINHKNNHNINIYNKDSQKMKKWFSVKPSLYMMPKDIILKDIFNISIKSASKYERLYNINNAYIINNKGNIDRKNILKKIKKFIIINHINYNIFWKTVFLYDLLSLKKYNAKNKFNRFSNFNKLSNLLIALISFILVLKFNKEENKMISLKKLVEYFKEEADSIKINEICEMEIIALKLINYNLAFQTPFSFMELFLINGIIFNEDCINSDLSFDIYELVNETLENLMVNSNEYFKYNFFYLCCSIIVHVREKYRIDKWPRTLEVTFGVNFEDFSDIYNIFFIKKNKSNNNSSHKNNIRSFYNADVINISNLKSMNNILSVLKIMKSVDKHKNPKENVNKLDLFNKKNDKEENSKEKINCNFKCNENIISSNKIKVGLKKKWNLGIIKSPDKLFSNKASSISSIITKLSEEKKNMISDLYSKNIQNTYIRSTEKTNNNNNHDNQNNFKNRIKEGRLINKNEKIKEDNNYKKNSNSIELFKNESFNIVEKNKINMTKSCNRSIKDFTKIYQENNKVNMNKNSNKANGKNNNYSKIDNNYNNNTVNINIYKKRHYLFKNTSNLLKNYHEKNKQKIANNLNNSKNNSNTIKNDNYSNKIKNRYYSKYTGKKKIFESNKDINDTIKRKDELNINKTSFNHFLFYKNKKNKNIDVENKNILDRYNIKNKEENSNAPTCESSNIKTSINDFSIRKSYRLKKRLTKKEDNQEEKVNFFQKNENMKNEKEGRIILEKNKSYNKLLNSKIGFSDSTYNRKTGVRKFYKQKNLLENH